MANTMFTMTLDTELRARRLKEAGPNKATRKAISELEAGKGKKFDDVAALMADLHRDDWC